MADHKTPFGSPESGYMEHSVVLDSNLGRIEGYDIPPRIAPRSPERIVSVRMDVLVNEIRKHFPGFERVERGEGDGPMLGM